MNKKTRMIKIVWNSNHVLIFEYNVLGTALEFLVLGIYGIKLCMTTATN